MGEFDFFGRDEPRAALFEGPFERDCRDGAGEDPRVFVDEREAMPRSVPRN